MSDLGFGIVDRKSVLVVLLTIFASAAVFGNPLPIDMSTPANIFGSLIVLTGFVYLARTLGRLVIAVVFTLIVGLPITAFQTLKSRPYEYDHDNPRGFRKVAILVWTIVKETFIGSILIPFVSDTIELPIYGR